MPDEGWKSYLYLSTEFIEKNSICIVGLLIVIVIVIVNIYES